MRAYALTIFAAAFLLFQVQPLIGRYLLPWFGGAPAVWTTCLLFFQAALLGGYGYAHLSSRYLRPRRQALVHLGLILAALVTLPIIPSDSWKPTSASDPTLRIVALLTVSLGLPYLTLASTAPLLQSWFNRTEPGVSPYRLYALSNAGSLLALLSYPTFVESWLTRQTQATIWGVGLGLYGMGCACCAWRLWQSCAEPVPASPAEMTGPGNATSAGQRVLWVLLPACASLLLLAVTNKVCQDVAPVAFLWVIPLTVYLLSFIICFEKPLWYRRGCFGPALMLALGITAMVLMGRLALSVPVQITVYVGTLFICSLVCHGEVYRLKPAPAGLTGFYLSIAAGGALGGVFVAVVAPAVLADYFELPWGLLACGGLYLLALARENPRLVFWFRAPETAVPAAKQPATAWPAPLLARGAWLGSLLLLMGLGVLIWNQVHKHARALAFRNRNFYGVLKVYAYHYPEPTQDLVELLHGGMVHGMQYLAPERARLPTLYYDPASGVGLAMTSLRQPARHIGVVGLGAGTLAAYAKPGDRFRFYELNPQVERVARQYFSYLKECPARTRVVLGDARLSLEREPSQQFDLLVLDAFNSDSIPVHLLTRQAFLLYRRHLKPAGIIAVHVSNMSLDLQPVVLGAARALGLQAAIIQQPRTDPVRGVLPSIWVLLAAEPSALPVAPNAPGGAGARETLWTDDFSSLFPVLRWRELWHPRPAGPAQVSRMASAVVNPGELSATITRLRKALEQEPDSVTTLNNLACLLATAPEAAWRNGTQAVQLAERACRLTQRTNAVTLATLAAAYAEAGRFDEAVATAERACSLAKQTGLRELFERNQQLLQLYRSGRAYHQSPAPN